MWMAIAVSGSSLRCIITTHGECKMSGWRHGSTFIITALLQMGQIGSRRPSLRSQPWLPASTWAAQKCFRPKLQAPIGSNNAPLHENESVWGWRQAVTSVSSTTRPQALSDPTDSVAVLS